VSNIPSITAAQAGAAQADYVTHRSATLIALDPTLTPEAAAAKAQQEITAALAADGFQQVDAALSPEEQEIEAAGLGVGEAGDYQIVWGDLARANGLAGDDLAAIDALSRDFLVAAGAPVVSGGSVLVDFIRDGLAVPERGTSEADAVAISNRDTMLRIAGSEEAALEIARKADALLDLHPEFAAMVREAGVRFTPASAIAFARMFDLRQHRADLAAKRRA
jgi:hypothetical protein